MPRLTYSIVLAASLYATAARAGQAEIAAQLNEEGKNLMFAGKYAEASDKFANAVARVPEAKYFFNLCMSRYQEGKFGEALTACNSVEKNGADDSLKGKAQKLGDKIKATAKEQGLDLEPQGGGAAPGDTPPATGGGDQPPPNGGGTPPPNGGGAVGAPPASPAFAVGRPPSQGLFVAQAPEHNYTWTLGIDLFFGGGKIGGQNMLTGEDFYGSAAGGFRLKSDYLLSPASKVGAQGYIQVTHFNANQAQMAAASAVSTLDVIDVGAALYKHLCQGNGRLCFTPLAGIQLALFSPENMTDGAGSQVFNYSALGARVEAGLSYALGSRYEHVLSIQLGANLYTKAFASPTDCMATATCAADVGLDSGGKFGYLGFGYTYRFNTPLGQAAFVTLE